MKFPQDRLGQEYFVGAKLVIPALTNEKWPEPILVFGTVTCINKNQKMDGFTYDVEVTSASGEIYTIYDTETCYINILPIGLW